MTSEKSPSKGEQLDIMMKRLTAAGANRRSVLKIAAAAAGAVAGGVALGGNAGAAPSMAPKMRSAAHQAEEQIFYMDGRWTNPTSFDFNLNLYCNAEPEVWSGVLTFDENLNAAADWADRWESNADASVWTFYIRQGNTGWSDGSPVTANDFVFSWERQLNPANGAAYAGFLFDIKNAEKYNSADASVTAADLGVKAIDEWTLEVTMEGPRGYFPQVVGYTAAVPSPQWEVEARGDRWAIDLPIVTSGPFQVDAWENDVKLEMSVNPNHWDAANIKLTKVISPIYPNSNNVLYYEEGTGDAQVDWTVLAAADFQRYSADAELATQLSPYVYPGIWMLLPQATIAPFDDINVRQAVSHAIDRDRLATVTNGLVTPAYCQVSPGVFGFLDDPALAEIQKFDPAAAMEHLVGTPFEGGQNWPAITMYMRAGEETYNADIMANDLVAQLKENLGMDVSIQAVPQTNFSAQLYENKWELVFIRWWLDYPDPNNCYGDMFYSRKSSGKRQAWSNDEFDDLVNVGKAEPDPAKRLEIYKQCETIIQTDVGYMPLVYRTDFNVFKPWVKNVPVNAQGYQVPDGNIYQRMLTKVSVEGRA
jgi:oligopeptide transport system substrate-binding protein